MVKIFKSLFQKFLPPHRSTLLCSNAVKFVRREIGEIVRYLPDQKTTKIRLPLKLFVQRSIAPKICRGQPPAMCLHFSRFHRNRFIFGGVITERVNTIFAPYISNIRPKLCFALGE